MKARSLVSLASVVLATAFVAGCPEDAPPTGGTRPGTKTTGTQPATTGTGDTKAASTGDAVANWGKGVIKGTVSFAGTAPEMKVPAKRKEAEFCKDKEVVYNAVVVKDGKLKDVAVYLAPGQLKGDYKADGSITVDQKDCMYEPRMQVALTEQEILVKNSDPTLHNVNAGKGATTLFNTAQPKDAPELKKSFDEPGVHRFKCDVHAWMRAFVVVADSPFHAVSGEDGTYTIGTADKGVPDGKYKLVAWHSQFGEKTQDIEVKGGEVTADFSYDGKEGEPAENQGELKDLF